MSTALLDLVDWPVRTERLVLRPATLDDVDAVFAIRTRPDVARWITAWHRDPESFAEGWPGRLAQTLVVCLPDGTLVGDLMVRPEDGWAQAEVAASARGTQAELGWTLDPDHGGQGLATEAVTALLDLCFGPLGVRRVTAACFAANDASWRLMERVGMRREAHNVADSLHRDLGWVDGYLYAILAEEWRGGTDR